LLDTLALETRQKRLDGSQKHVVCGVFPGVTPRANVKPGVPREILSIHGAVLEIRSMAIKASGLVIGDLMFPDPERKFGAGLRREDKTAIPQRPGPRVFM